jgi:hypothetical protein
MFGSEILEVAAGVILVFLLVSIICTALREGIEGYLKTRAAFLEHGIRELLHDRYAVGLARSFYTHPIINGLYSDQYAPRTTTKRPSSLTHGGMLPTYIPSRNFALTLMDIAARGPANRVAASNEASPVLTLDIVRANLVNIENAPVQRVLLTAIDTAEGDLDKAVANLAAWYDSSMDRVSGAYKRATHKLLLALGFVVAVILNVNPIAIADYLSSNDAARAAVVARAEAVARDPDFLKRDSTNQYASARAALDSIRLPIGWAGVDFGLPEVEVTKIIRDSTGVARPQTSKSAFASFQKHGWDYVFSPLIGWLITALAATLGAPFWFDMLNKVMVVRSTVKPHEKSPEESSEDRQNAKDKAKTARGDVGAATKDAAAVGAGQGGRDAKAAETEKKVEDTQTEAARAAARAEDQEEEFDGCSLVPSTLTSDEDLPAAEGGVATHV